jgi:hypothetical protein
VAINPPQNELEVEGQFELADQDDRWIIAPQRQQIAASDLTFDNEAEPFEEGLVRPIKPSPESLSRFVPPRTKLPAFTFAISEWPDRLVFGPW